MMEIRKRSRIIVFFFTFFVWIALTGVSLQELIAGVVFAAVITLSAGHFFITTERGKDPGRRFIYALRYIVTFFWEMIKANFHVAYLVIHPLTPIKPGIVKIKTELTKDSALTVLCNSITLTPGTLTVDINKEKKEIYIHCIDVKHTDIITATKEISYKFEHLLKEVFE